MEAAEVMNQFFIDKVNDLRKKALLPSTAVPEDAQAGWLSGAAKGQVVGL
jgi:hypothetical protein